MPDDAARGCDSEVARFRRWLRRLTLWQYALLMLVVELPTLTALTAVANSVPPHFVSWKPFSLFQFWFLGVLMTAAYTWMRWDARRRNRDGERPPGQGK